MAVRIEMDGFPEGEIIINPISIADSSLRIIRYYKKHLWWRVNHKHVKGIKI